MLTTKQRKFKKLVETIVKKQLREEIDTNEQLVQQVAEYCDYNQFKIYEFMLLVLTDANFSTEAKYLRRLFNDIKQSGQIEKTKFYSSGIY